MYGGPGTVKPIGWRDGWAYAVYPNPLSPNLDPNHADLSEETGSGGWSGTFKGQNFCHTVMPDAFNICFFVTVATADTDEGNAVDVPKADHAER